LSSPGDFVTVSAEPTLKKTTGGYIKMGIEKLFGWKKEAAPASACGAADKPAACGAADKPAACGAADKPAACGAADKPAACGAADK